MYSEIEEASPVLDSKDEYSTITTPEIEDNNDIEYTLDDIAVNDYDPSSNDDTEQNEPQSEQNEEQIDTLFSSDGDSNSNIDTPVKKKNSSVAVIVALLLVISVAGAAGYFGYNMYIQNANSSAQETEYNSNKLENIGKTSDNIQKTDAMPVESVEKNNLINNVNEGNQVEIPVIEQNLDASVLVSNLKVDWEVPSGYVTNTSAKRYLVKLGKVIQLNLKADLLLLSKPPISNKITVEIKYNNDNKKFETVGIVVSSGEKYIDDLILQTVNKALSMNISVNTDSFGKLQGNPILVIHL
jgi:hypothetical protein